MGSLCHTVHALKKVNVLLAYYTYGYGCTTPTAMGLLHLQLRVNYAYSYGRIMATTTGVLQAYYGHVAGCKLTSSHYSCNCER